MSLDSYGAASMGALVQEAPRPGVFTDGDHIVADDGYEPVDYLSVGEVADLLGVAPATLRSWGRRYGLVPAARTEGGHRRYTPDEVDRLRRMQELVGCGVMPAAAARQVLSEAATQPGRTDGSGAVVPVRLRALPGSRPLAVA
ncbi:MAG: MerR family transcriptional regulator, partial [Actinomycetota bacterium]|nr:MerR family transcriptional regulator [Actinomycetota bacterium]